MARKLFSHSGLYITLAGSKLGGCVPVIMQETKKVLVGEHASGPDDSRMHKALTSTAAVAAVGATAVATGAVAAPAAGVAFAASESIRAINDKWNLLPLGGPYPRVTASFALPPNEL